MALTPEIQYYSCVALLNEIALNEWNECLALNFSLLSSHIDPIPIGFVVGEPGSNKCLDQ